MSEIQVEAIEFGGGEQAVNKTFFIRVIYRCPHCRKKRKQLINGAGVMPVEVAIKPTCDGETLRVVAWDAANYQIRLDEARSRAKP